MIPKAWSHLANETDICDLQRKLILKYGGRQGAPLNGCVDGSLGGAYNAELYGRPDAILEDYVEGPRFAAYLLFYLVTKHCFTDGNKRIGWAACTDVLYRLGLVINATDDDAVEFCNRIASGELRNGDEVQSWISERLAAGIE